MKTQDWSLEPVDSQAPASRLLFRDSPVANCKGVALEAQFSVPDGYLLFTTDDIPFEEVLHIILLDREKLVVETRSIGRPYTPAIAANFGIEDDAVLFDFPAGVHWRASIRPARLLSGRLQVKRCGD